MYASHTILVFNITNVFTTHSNARLRNCFFCLFLTRLISYISYRSYSYISESMFSYASSSALNLLFSCRMISSTACLTISLLSCFILNFFIFEIFYPRSLVGIILEYLEPKSPKTLHSSDECPGPWMTQLVWIYPWFIFLPFSALASDITCLGVNIWQGGLLSHFPAVTSMVGICPSRVFLKKILQHLHKYILLCSCVKTCLHIF